MDALPVPRRHPAITWVVVGFVLLTALVVSLASLGGGEVVDTITVRVTGFKVGGNDPCDTLDPDRVLKNITIREGETTVARLRILARDAEVWNNWGRHKRRCTIRVEQAVRVPNVDPAAVTVTGDGETKTLPREYYEPDCPGCGVRYVYIPGVRFVARRSEPRGTAVGAQDE